MRSLTEVGDGIPKPSYFKMARKIRLILAPRSHNVLAN